MAEASSVSKTVSGTDKVLTFETGKLAPQSQGSVVAGMGDTRVLITANAESSTREGIDFFPLTIDIEEKAYAAGKIPGSFFRREARPPDSAILTCRLIDRPLRPSFAAGYRNETQVVGTVIGADQVNPYDVVAINGASAALMISGIPFEGPVGAVRLAYSRTGEWIPYPTYEEGDDSTFEIVVAGRQTDSGDVAIMMVEASSTENAFRYFDEGAPKVTEAVVAGGLDAAKVWIKESIDLQNELVAKVGSKPTISFTSATDYGDDVFEAVSAFSAKVLEANTIADKTERNQANDAVKAEIRGAIGEQFAGREKEVSEAIRSLTKKLIRKRVIDEGVRMDGRGVRDLRPVSAEVGVIPTAHGSGLFQRGETQVLNVTTLGMPRMDQLLDTLSPEDRKRYMHHYNMPPFANGETGRMGGTKRRELGHGLLAERAVLPLVPAQDEWPYAIRLVSEVLSSNGSTSMGSVCASSLSLMDAGVPLREHVAGIAMGLIYENGTYTALTDILGSEDAFGDMDFKVAGTADVVTALQLDTKIDGLPADVLAAALDQAKEARLAILEVMKQAIAEPRAEVQGTAPKIVSFPIPLDRIGEIIGPKGKVINQIQQDTGADIAVDDDGVTGTVTIGSKDGTAVEEARRTIELILNPPSVELGTVYKGKVVNITKFGAFVNILPGRDGLVHISKLGGGKRIDRVEDVVNLGDEIDVLVEDIDPNGKVSLRPQGEGFDIPEGQEPAPRRERSERAPREDRGDRAPRGDREESGGGAKTVSFEDEFEAELKSEFGDLGPGGAAPAAGGDTRSSDRDRNRRPRGGRR